MTDTLSTWPMDNPYYVEEMNPVTETVPKDRALINRVLNHKHMVETIERFEWINLPNEIPSDLIERVLFFRFKGALFKSDLGRYMFLPFALKGVDSRNIDSYGRYENIIPVLFTGQWSLSGDGEDTENIAYMPNRSYNVVYDLPNDEETETASIFDESGNEEVLNLGLPDSDKKAIILADSSLEISQDYTPMSELCKPFNEQLTDILVLVNMDLINSSKVFYIVAKDEAMKTSIEQEFRNLDKSILNGKRHFVVTSQMDFKEMVGSSAKDSARYFQSYQSIDNLRKDFIGIDNGGTFMKQEHTTNMETQKNSNSGSAVLNNALRMRKEFCAKVNKVFGLSIDVELREQQQQQIVEPQGSQTKDLENSGDE